MVHLNIQKKSIFLICFVIIDKYLSEGEKREIRRHDRRAEKRV